MGYKRRLRSNLEMQRLREKIKIEPGDAVATGEDEGEGYGKRHQQRRWNEDDRILGSRSREVERKFSKTRSVGHSIPLPLVH
ncbi:hypothetical protein D8674_042258 [Pyrus ussuriensis x Pyrus communis]|uniref:Uncharacterized protein n=1 Tax=Pyrus ussuriensis x Pyrus communis TaxID=2448454 RepID=A0A5N5GLU2_9ROSA|nr:hypothetical protein D8674_042258 [Pyrus ussuriensis x Pyrus communis]